MGPESFHAGGNPLCENWKCVIAMIHMIYWFPLMIVVVQIVMKILLNARRAEPRRPAAGQWHDLAGVPAGKQDAA